MIIGITTTYWVRKDIATHHRILARRQEIKAKTGLQPNSTALIRRLRFGEDRR